MIPLLHECKGRGNHHSERERIAPIKPAMNFSTVCKGYDMAVREKARRFSVGVKGNDRGPPVSSYRIK